MTTPPAFAALRRDVAPVVEAALKAERDGRRSEARGGFERAIRMLTRDEAEFVPGLIRKIARTYIDDGMFDAALDCLAAAQHLSRARGDTSGVAHAMNQMGGANLHRGDLESAEALYHKAQVLAEAAKDAPLEAMVSQNLGIVAGMRGNLETALNHYRASLATYRSQGLNEYIGLVSNNMAMAYASLGRWTEAEQSFEDALAHNKATGDVPAQHMIKLNLADMWISRGEVDRAAPLCDEVFGEAQTLGDQRALGEASKLLGVIARTRSDHAKAERLLEEAHTNAMKREDLLLAAETAREQAELFEALGRNQDTLRALGLSHRLYGKLRAERGLADLAKRVERLEARFYDIVNRWAQTIESKDPYTAGHCERVAEYACLLARDAGIDDLQMFWFRIGALLHDVGKIEVPTEILTKAGPLTPEERRIMERHAPVGSELLRDVEFPWDILPMVRGHHERWDGAGYPDRLAGDQIPLSARVLCIADVYDALSSDRPYRAGYSRDEALTIMQGEVGRIFDADLYDRFVSIVNRAGISSPLLTRV